MAIDREPTIRRAEKLLKQGKLEAAIAEYVQAVNDQPRDWNSANTLGDLYVRAGKVESAVSQYTRVAEHFAREGFFQKAAALYKKIAKIKPQDENVLLQLADLSEQQGLLADAKSCLSTVAERRRRRGDRKGSAEIILRLAGLDPADVSAAILAARAASELGDTVGAAARFKVAGAELLRRGRTDEGLRALSEAAALDPADAELRRSLGRAAMEAGQVDRARKAAPRPGDEAGSEGVPGEMGADDEPVNARSGLADFGVRNGTAGSKPSRAGRAGDKPRKGRGPRRGAPDEVAGADSPLQRAERELRSGNYETARAILGALAAEGSVSSDALFSLAEELVDDDADAAFACVDLASDTAIAAESFDAAAAALQAFVRRVPDHVAALMKLIEISVDGGLDASTYEAQAQLADAYLSTGRAADARVVAEDLVAREPSQPAHVDRLRRALVALGEPEPDRVIADHLSGASPLALTALWAEASRNPVVRADEPAEPAPAPPPETPEEPEIELDFRELNEPLIAGSEGAAEDIFEKWLGAQPPTEARAEREPAESPEAHQIAAFELEAAGEMPSPSPDQPFDDLLEAVVHAGALAPATPESEVLDRAPETVLCDREDTARAPEALTEETTEPERILPPSAPEPAPPEEATVEELLERPPDHPISVGSEVTPEQAPPEEATVEELVERPPDHPISVGSEVTPEQAPPEEAATVEEPLAPESEVVSAVEAPVDGDIEPLAPPALIQPIEDLIDLAPEAPAPSESAAEFEPPIPDVPSTAVTPAAAPPEAPADPSAVPESDVVECAEADVVEVTAAVLEEPVESTVASLPEPEDEGVFEPLAASLPMVADLADSIVVLDAAPDSDADGGFVAESDTVAPDGIPGAPAAEAMPAIPVPLAEGVEVDLSTAIGELRAGIEPMGSEAAATGPRAAGQAEDLDRVFESFRDEAALRGLADAGAQHLKLAAAYREIGMIDECIGSLEEASHSPRHRFEAASLLAETLREQGRTREAVEWYERAAEAPAPAAEAGRRLLFELGKTLADVGESERALAVFLEIQADAPDYCDVAARVRRLSSAT